MITRIIQAALGTTMLGVGASAALKPAAFTTSYAEPADPATTDQAEYLTRMWALRETALGAVLLSTTTSPHRRRTLAVTALLAATEAGVTVRSRGLSAQNRKASIASAAVFGLLSAVAAAKG